MKHAYCSAALALGLAALPAHAVDISAGVAALLSMRDCVAGASGCDDIVAPAAHAQYGGFPGASTSSASLSFAAYGAVGSSVSLSGSIGAPVIQASASSQPGKRLLATAVAVQRYVYDGAVPTTRTFGGTLTYSQVLTGYYPMDMGGINAVIEVFSLPASTIPVGSTARENFDTLYSGLRNLPGFASLGWAQHRDVASNPAGIGNVSVTVNLDPGDAVWIQAFVQTPATNGGWTDSSNTFVTAWDDPAGLTPAVVAVPEPATWMLMLAGAAAVLRSAVRAQRQRALA